MNSFSEKIHLTLEAPTEEHPLSDQERILQALKDLGYPSVSMTLATLRGLYPLCRTQDWDITVTLVHTPGQTLLTAVEGGDTTAAHYGLAVDLGSTTVVMQMIDMNTKAVLAEAKAMNGQIRFGDDILTRIIYAKDDPAHQQELAAATQDTFLTLFQTLEAHCGISADHCAVMILSGNTTMIHFLLGLDAWTVFSSPYAPVTTAPGAFFGHEIGLAFSGVVYIIPAIANYLGGDITSGLLTTDFYKKDGLSVFFDIGTNGELVLGNSSFLIAGAGAAGPALEGGISRYGMRACDTAIDSIRIEGASLTFTTIGNTRPAGICGSGIIDLIAQMRLNGWIDISGKLDPEASDRIVFLPEAQEYAAVYATAEESAHGEMLYFSQTDILQYLDTKAAAHTMVDCLLEASGFTENDITAFYTAGAFGTYANLESAVTVGIFPDLPRERFHCLQNSSLAGARELLLDKSRTDDIQYLLDTVYCIQFASMPDFLIKMQASKFIPHTDMRMYPTVETALSTQTHKNNPFL